MAAGSAGPHYESLQVGPMATGYTLIIELPNFLQNCYDN